ncbi:MAG: DUF47 domain-containing protein [Acidobacteria bacterium]|nr:DUF47 domain-containing protein [Acidobacteriota bacterium]HMU32669.1 DUF47 family protein [Pyrinomonadaceae bacterium]
MGFSLLPKEDQYFALFSRMSGKLQEAAGALEEMLAGPDTQFDSFAKRIKSIEHECDELTHTVTTRLNSSFITPFDREDIYTLCVALDDVCDYIDGSARAVVMYDIHEIHENANKLASVIRRQSNEVKAAVDLLEKGKGLGPHLLEIQRLENEADDVYFGAMADLFKNSTNPVNIVKWKEFYEMLEAATDKCEYVGNIIESIVLKHN